MATLFRTAAGLCALAIATALALSSGPAIGAGAHKGGHGHHAADFGRKGAAAEVTRTVTVTMYDTYFEPKGLTIKKGETIRFVIENKGELVHEFNIGTAAMHAAHQKEMEMMVEHGVLEPDKINHHMMNKDMGGGHVMKHDDPNSVLLEPAKSAELIWTFTKDAALEFACNVPGHYDAGMVGNITVSH